MQNNVGQRHYLIKEEGSEVSLMPSGTLAQDSKNLFNVDVRKNCSKIEKLFFQHFEDQNLLPVASPVCDSCQGCHICADPFKAQRRQLDQLVTWKDGPHQDGGGYHIKLLFDKDKLARVDKGRSQALWRLLSIERMLARAEMAQVRLYFNQN